MDFYFSVANNVVPVEDIIEMRSVGDMPTRSARYDARIRYHYIAWALKIRLDNLNEVNNGFTLMVFFTWRCHKIEKYSFLYN